MGGHENRDGIDKLSGRSCNFTFGSDCSPWSISVTEMPLSCERWF